MSERTIWYSADARRWWMESTDPATAARVVLAHPDAIHVTNAYAVLPSEFVNQLRLEAEPPQLHSDPPDRQDRDA